MSTAVRRNMKFKLQMIVWASVCLLLVPRKGHLNNFEWSSVLPYVYEMCQVENDCSGSVLVSNESKRHSKNVCCKGCLCADECYDNERIEKVYPGLTKCLNTVENEPASIRYRFIVNASKDGCIISETSPTELKPSCKDDIEAAPWGNFYPVYSFDKMANFKNEQCALCHGATNSIKWNVYAYFLGKNSRKLTVLRQFYRYLNSSGVTLAFFPPNRESREHEHICHIVKDKCIVNKQDPFKIPASINLTHKQVVQACDEGEISPYIYSTNGFFKNVFCAICQSRVSKVTGSLICDESVINVDDNIKGSGQSFASLIDQKFIESKLDKQRRKNPIKLACLHHNAYDTPIKDPCREVLCPALQVRQQDGNCHFPMNRIFTTRLTVHLNLTTSGIVQKRQLWNMSKTDIETIFKKAMPWPKNWEIIEIFRRTDMPHRNSSEFYISVGYKQFDFVDMRYLRRLITTALSRYWIINLEQTFTFEQKFHAHGFFQKIIQPGDDIVSMKPKWAVRHGINDIFVNLSSPSWEVFLTNTWSFYFQPPGEPFEFTNLYFCELIEMFDFEFVGSTNDFPLLLKRSGKILYPWQYYMYMEENGNNTAHVCIEDSDFKLDQDKDIGTLLKMSPKHLFFIILAFHLFPIV